MIEQPLVSIAVCTFNGSCHLEEQILSLINQTYQNLEIIIIDDRSTDGTLDILKLITAKDRRIRLYENLENLGYVKNFEKAIGLCKGEFIALCDQDDIWCLNKVESLLESIGPAALIYHDSEFIGEDGVSLNKKMSEILNMYHGDSSLPFLFYNCVSGHSLFMKASLRNSFLPFDKIFYHDWAIAFAAAENGGIRFFNETLVKYRQHSKSNTDILKIKPTDLPTFRTKVSEIQPMWLVRCRTRTHLHKQYITDLLDCFTEERKIKNNSRLKLFFLLLKNYRLLFALKTKNTFSKLNYIRKMCFRFNTQSSSC